MFSETFERLGERLLDDLETASSHAREPLVRVAVFSDPRRIDRLLEDLVLALRPVCGGVVLMLRVEQLHEKTEERLLVVRAVSPIPLVVFGGIRGLEVVVVGVSQNQTGVAKTRDLVRKSRLEEFAILDET